MEGSEKEMKNTLKIGAEAVIGVGVGVN